MCLDVGELGYQGALVAGVARNQGTTKSLTTFLTKRRKESFGGIDVAINFVYGPTHGMKICSPRIEIKFGIPIDLVDMSAGFAVEAGVVGVVFWFQRCGVCFDPTPAVKPGIAIEDFVAALLAFENESSALTMKFTPDFGAFIVEFFYGGLDFTELGEEIDALVVYCLVFHADSIQEKRMRVQSPS